MTGEVKAGRGSLIGNAGEYYVVAELLKRGIVAALAPRNARAFDVLATNGDRTIRIRVKTKSHAYQIWQWSANAADGTIFPQLSKHGDFTVLVNLATDRRDLAFYIVPTPLIDEWLRRDFENWLRTPGKKGQQRSAANRKRHLPMHVFDKEWQHYRENWDVLWS